MKYKDNEKRRLFQLMVQRKGLRSPRMDDLEPTGPNTLGFSQAEKTLSELRESDEFLDQMQRNVNIGWATDK